MCSSDLDSSEVVLLCRLGQDRDLKMGRFMAVGGHISLDEMLAEPLPSLLALEVTRVCVCVSGSVSVCVCVSDSILILLHC